MRENAPSTTAQLVALLRSILSSPKIGLVDDPYAQALLHPAYQIVSRSLQGYAGRLVMAATDLGSVGLVSMLAGRTRYFDEVIQGAMQRGIRQVVLLGAGYDARALRLTTDGVKFFEVDHPATQSDKKQKVEALGRAYPATLVTVDFTKDRLQDRLLASGFNSKEPTFFLWEGVTMYLNEDQVRGGLRAIKELAAPTSQLSFDSVRRGTSMFNEVMAQVGAVTFKGFFGEPIHFRVDPEPLRALLEEEGWELLEVFGAADLYDKYLSYGPMIRPRDLGFVSLAEVK